MIRAVEVRGHQESRAARVIAQEPGRHDQSPTMQEATETLDASISALSRPGKLNDHFTRLAQAGSKEVHAAILASSWNDHVGYACVQISHLPMLAVGAMASVRSVDRAPDQFERGIFRPRLGNGRRQAVREAIECAGPARAKGMMREHAHAMIEHMQMFGKRGRSLTAADLVANSAADPPAPAA